MLDRFTAEQFIPQVPYYDEEGFPIAEYKRIFLAKQAANQARKEFQARIDVCFSYFCLQTFSHYCLLVRLAYNSVLIFINCQLSIIDYSSFVDERL